MPTMIGVKSRSATSPTASSKEFMLAGERSRRWSPDGEGFGFLHRVHEPPSPKSIVEFEQIARSFGYSLGVEVV
ncbi:MAG: hypothetical protein R2748_06230 [Bryobacterales bacterium]